ncbi:hypothetical protein Tco_0777279 [Tanacetum coccineum]
MQRQLAAQQNSVTSLQRSQVSTLLFFTVVISIIEILKLPQEAWFNDVALQVKQWVNELMLILMVQPEILKNVGKAIATFLETFKPQRAALIWVTTSAAKWVSLTPEMP